jgi:hypothetical protein
VLHRALRETLQESPGIFELGTAFAFGQTASDAFHDQERNRITASELPQRLSDLTDDLEQWTRRMAADTGHTT